MHNVKITSHNDKMFNTRLGLRTCYYQNVREINIFGLKSFYQQIHRRSHFLMEIYCDSVQEQINWFPNRPCSACKTRQICCPSIGWRPRTGRFQNLLVLLKSYPPKLILNLVLTWFLCFCFTKMAVSPLIIVRFEK